MTLKDISLIDLIHKLNSLITHADISADKRNSFVQLELHDSVSPESLSTQSFKLKSFIDIHTPLNHEVINSLFGEGVQVSLVNEFSGHFTPKPAIFDSNLDAVFDALLPTNSKNLFSFTHNDVEHRILLAVSDGNYKTIIPAQSLCEDFITISSSLVTKQEAILLYQQKQDNLLDCFSEQEKSIVCGLYEIALEQSFNIKDITGSFQCDDFKSEGANKVVINGQLNLHIKGELAMSLPLVVMQVETDGFGALLLKSLSFPACMPWVVSCEHSTHSPECLTMILRRIHEMQLDLITVIKNGFSAEDVLIVYELTNME